MRQKLLAKKHSVSESQISRLMSGERTTTNYILAMDIARLTGKKPIEHIPANLRGVYLVAYPELNRKIKQ